MPNYGIIACGAASIAAGGVDPRLAWEQALVAKNKSPKACPRTAFLGLCENGNIQLPMSGGVYLNRRRTPNKTRAIDIRDMIYATNPPALPQKTIPPAPPRNMTKREVWFQVAQRQNDDQGVIDVVYELFNAGLLK